MRILSFLSAHLGLLTLPLCALEFLSPLGGQRGTDVTLTLIDPNISSFQELITYQTGLSLTDLKPDEKDKSRATATLHIAPDAPLGEHSLRIRTAYGISYLRTFWVGSFPTVLETEPNTLPDQAQRIALNTTIHGIITTEDEDGFLVTLKKGQRLSVEAEAMRLGRILFDTHLRIIGPRNIGIAQCDDTPFLKTDPAISIIAPEDGDYRIVIREAAYEGTEQSAYRLHIGTNPRPTAVFPPGGKPGETLNLTFIGDPSGSFTQSVTLPATGSSFSVFPIQNGESSPSPLPIVVSPLEHAVQSNANTKPNSAHPLPAIPSAVDGILDGSDSRRWFSFQAKKGQNLDIRVIARSIRSPLDSLITLHDAKFKKLADNDDEQPSPDSLIKWTCPEDGTYLIQLRDQLERTGADFTFRIAVNIRQPAIAASIPITDRNDSQKGKFFSVPRGNRFATVIQLKRDNTACDIAFETAALPPGIRMMTPPVPKSLNSFPVVFEAADDAPLSSSLQSFTIRALGDKAPQNLTAPLADTIHLIEVNNEGTYHSVNTDRIPLAVTEATPFSIELAPPATPIVRNGTLSLAMRVIRNTDFKAKITTRLPWNPPGISGPANIDIAPEAADATYELNAAADAAPGDWQICVTAEADAPGGRRAVSSMLVPLRIEDPYLNFSLDLAAAHIGEPSALVAKIEQLRDFSGEATAELLSLPHGVTSSPVKFTKDKTEIIFPLNISKDTKPGKTTGLLCRVLVPARGGNITHMTGQGGTLRIDPAAKTETTPPPEKPKTGTATVPPAPEKPLSRLEQLRRKKQ